MNSSPVRIIRCGFRFRLRGDAKIEALLRRYEGCCRKVWNLALAEQQARYRRGEKYANYVAMAKWLTAWRAAAETAYLSAVPVHFLQKLAKQGG